VFLLLIHIQNIDEFSAACVTQRQTAVPAHLETPTQLKTSSNQLNRRYN